MQSPITASASEFLEGIARIRELSKNGRHAKALAEAEALESAVPHNRDALYLIAANQRCLNQITEALATLQRLEQQHPQFGLLFQERGYCYVTLREMRQALEAFTQAVHLDPALAASWSMLERLCRMTGDSKGAETAAGQALIASRWNDIRVLLNQQRYLQAHEAIAAIPQIGPNIEGAYSKNFLSMDAAACAGLGQHVQAIALYRRLLAEAPESCEWRVAMGHSLKSVGRQKEAIESYQEAACIRPSFGDAYWSLANLKTYRFSKEEIACMGAEEAKPMTAPDDRYHLCFALGKAYEDLNEFAESWQYYERGNALKRAEGCYRPEIVEANMHRQTEVCTTEFFAARAGFGAPAPDPVFIVGLPRSGSTLIEQILASHSQVDGTQELPDIPRIVTSLEGSPTDRERSRYPSVLADLSWEDFRRLGERYIADTRPYRGKKPFFIDKMPNNFRHIGLIHLMLPNAKIIDVRREPMACCWSNFKQLFAGGQDFTYSMEDLARYYRNYLQLMRHWDAVLPGRVLRICYEDVVADLEKNVRRMIEFCGLRFEPACVEFYKSERSIHTASSEQVRQPIFRNGLAQWRNYEPWLGPLKDALGDAAIRYRE